MNYGPIDLLCNIGVVVLICTYLMLQLNKLSSDGLAYSLLNAIGAGLIVVSLLFNFNLSALMVEVVEKNDALNVSALPKLASQRVVIWLV